MGLGKTVMTIALILARPGRRGSNDSEITKKRRIDSETTTQLKPEGGTLVVCPLSLLSQWKVNFLPFFWLLFLTLNHFHKSCICYLNFVASINDAMPE